jgi:hypothetical protein
MKLFDIREDQAFTVDNRLFVRYSGRLQWLTDDGKKHILVEDVTTGELVPFPPETQVTYMCPFYDEAPQERR